MVCIARAGGYHGRIERGTQSAGQRSRCKHCVFESTLTKQPCGLAASVLSACRWTGVMTVVQCILAQLGYFETARSVGTGRHVWLAGWLAGSVVNCSTRCGLTGRVTCPTEELVQAERSIANVGAAVASRPQQASRTCARLQTARPATGPASSERHAPSVDVKIPPLLQQQSDGLASPRHCLSVSASTHLIADLK